MQQAQSDTTRWDRCVLAVRLSALGDVAMTIPSLYSACRRNPDTLIVLVTRPSMTGMFVNKPTNLLTVGVDVKAHKGVVALWRMWRAIVKKYHPDIIVDLHDVLRTKVLRLYAGINRIPIVTIDKGLLEKRRLTRSRGKNLRPLTSSHARYRDTLTKAKIACEPQADFKSLYAVRKADDALYAAVAQPPRKDERRIGIAPFAAHIGKIYPLDRMEEVVKRLAADGSKIFLFGAGDDETAILDRWAEQIDGVTSVAGKKIGFAGELALMSTLDVMLTMDSGNMHLASLTGTRVVSVWGATHPYCGFSGWRQDEADTVQLALTCRPCSVYGNKPCERGDYRCLAAITPDMIIDRINRPH